LNRKWELARMTWYEVAESLERQPVALVPIGSVEQHGKQTPLGMDVFLAEHVCKRVAERVECVVTPSVPFGLAQTFSAFPGTVVISPASLQAYLGDVLESLIRTGFKYIVVVDNHAGNGPVVRQLAWEIRQRHSLTIARLFPYGLGKDLGRDLFTEGTSHWGHGSEPVVTLAAALVPGDLRMDLAHEDDFHQFAGFETAGLDLKSMTGPNATVYLDYADHSRSGIKGDPRGADGERGRAYIDRIVDRATAFVEAFRRSNTQVPPAKVSVNA
jgi:creatinine amidohydrolase